jgi:hypothetical protein
MSVMRIALIAYAAAVPAVAIFVLALCRASARRDAMRRAQESGSDEKDKADA